MKSKIHLEASSEARKYTLICEHDSPLVELLEAICQFKKAIEDKIEEVNKQENQKVPEEEKEKESNDVVA